MAETARFNRCTGQALNWEKTHICVRGRRMQKVARLAPPDFEAFAKATKSLGVGLTARRRQPLAIKAARA
eukprot:1927394-Alexandrium_andersonii.AAC.1